VSFFLARTVVFQSRSNWVRPFVKFVCLVIATRIISYSMIQFMHSHLGINVLIAKMIAEGILYLGNFAVQREFVFARKSTLPDSA
jgi:putative flippase GtrA